MSTDTFCALEAFEGTWLVRRRIIDALTGTVSQINGTASITRDRFEEDSLLRHGAGEFAARRVYELDWGERNLAIRFSDGRPFVTLAATNTQYVEHRCGDDLYRGLFLFADCQRWNETWTVIGPRKNYRSFSRYLRMAACC